MNSERNWELRVDDRVYRQLERFPRHYAERILKSIESLIFDPHTGDIQKIKDEEYTWRRRVGDYRIFYKLYPQSRVVHVFWVERRTSKTY